MAGKKTPARLGVPGNPKHPPLLHSCLALGALQSPELTPQLAALPALPAHIPKSGRAAGRGAERSPFLCFIQFLCLGLAGRGQLSSLPLLNTCWS